MFPSLLVFIVLIGMKAHAKQGAMETEIRAHVGSTVALPCKLDLKKCGQLHSVKWYKDSTRVFVLSHAGQGKSEEERMNVSYTGGGEAFLRISNVEATDEATYKCEITYLEVIENCDVVQIVKLLTLKKPDVVKILENGKKSLSNSTTIGPKEEGDEVDLTCMTSGGKPTPEVKWYHGTTEITRAEYTISRDELGLVTNASSTLQLTLSRSDLMARFECRVMSIALEDPIISWIKIDVHVRPTNITLSGVNNHVVQGTNVMLTCDVLGARPAATVRWVNGTTPITNESLFHISPEDNNRLITHYVERDGTYTTKSTLVFKASHFENGQTFYCYAENSVTRKNAEPELHDSMILDVRHPPVIKVSPHNKTVNESTSLTGGEGTSVLLNCQYFANPQELIDIVWSRDGKNLSLTETWKYVGGTITNPPLYVNNITREDMGEYTCSLKNEVGSETSPDSIFLNVQYTPSVEVVMEPSMPVRAVERSNVLLVCNITSGNPSNLLKVRWFLDGQLMKEFPECNYTSYDENGNGEGNGGPFCGLDPSILSLEKVDETFAGNYTCQGRNLVGWGPVSEPQELIVYYPPSPAKLRYTPSQVIKGVPVTLDCTVDSLGRPDNVTYIWYRGSHQMTEITSSRYVIQAARLETRSNFTCIAENEGGQSDPATVFINVNAPPTFLNKPTSYQAFLYSSKNISLTCIVECYPECAIIWKKEGVIIDTDNNPLYSIEVQKLPPDVRKNDFESINSTLIWNMKAWPGQELNKSAPSSNYTCQSMPNSIGQGVSSKMEVAVDYPPEVNVNPTLVNVIENQVPSTVKCHAKGRPGLSYKWKKATTNKVLSENEELALGPLRRSESGKYICEVSNKHGTNSSNVYFNVQYAPECRITKTEKDSSPALVCTVDANPPEVVFTWIVKESNETFTTSSNVINDGLKSYLILDSSVDMTRTYYCSANNSVGKGSTCEKNVSGNLPWWKQLKEEKIIIIIASIIAIIIIVIIICIIIIMLCRRKRADTKYNNPLEMEERENPDGNCSNISDQSKWPLQPGVLIHVNKLNNVSISQLSSRVSPFKSTSVTRPSTYFKYKRNKSKVYARLERLKDLLGLSASRHHVPIGIKESASGVVTFKKINPNVPATAPRVINSRKRKKPGYAPNPSSIEDKARLGAVPPVGGTVDPLSDPDKGFYENLPFHGMQNPPNKPISIIAPFNQGNNAHSFTSSTKSLLPSNQSSLSTPFGSLSINNIPNKTIKRHQSFHGFQNVQTPLTNIPLYFPFSGNMNNAYLNSYASQQFRNIHTQNASNRFIPSIFSQLPPNFGQTTGFNTISGIPIPNNQNNFHKVQSYDNINNTVSHQAKFNPFITSPPYTVTPQPSRITGRNESQFDIRRTASGINPPQNNSVKDSQANKPASRKSYSNKKLATIAEKRFGSLDIKKHKCYSPTFYSMRCKKHAKKRPIVYALPKKCFSDIEGESNNKSTISNNENNNDFENLTDSIQIFEQTTENIDKGGDVTPVPAPRCKKHRKSEIVYANISPTLNSTDVSNSSIENSKNEPSVTEVQIHVPNETNSLNRNADENSVDVVDGTDIDNKENLNVNKSNKLDINEETVNMKNFINKSDHSPKLVAVSPKQNPSKLMISPHALKNSPTLKVSPNFVKPKTESPKGALSLQIKAKIKPSPVQSPADNPNKTILTDSKDEEKATEQFPDIPQMPILNPQTKWSPNIANASNQNAFYTLTTPHFKQLNPVVPPQYSATIPHQKHAKLIPKALFQEQLSKSKSFSSKSKQKKHHFQIPLQKCHSFKFQTAESYFQPIKNIHEENLIRNGYATDYPESSHHGRHHKRDKPKQKTKGPLVLRRPIEYQENIHFQENMQNSVQLQYPQPMLGRNVQNAVTNKPNGVVYADLDMPTSNNKKSSFDSSSSKTKSQKTKPKTEYATLKFNEVGQEIDV